MKVRANCERLIIGSAQFGMAYGLIRNEEKLRQEDVRKILMRAYENGIRSIDTAVAYGDSEAKCGEAIKTMDPSSWEITTKVNGRDKSLIPNIEQSINALGEAKKNILSHCASAYINNQQFREQLFACKESYGVNKVGVSVYDKHEILSVMSVQPPDIIQAPINLLDKRLLEDGLLSEVRSQGVEIHARSIFLQGMFFLPIASLNEKFPTGASVLGEMWAIAKKENITVAELALSWVSRITDVDRVIIGVSSVGQLNEHIEAIGKTISEEAYGEIMSMRIDDEAVLDPRQWFAQ
jgi:aryl-alcohol dehydrogenase-like predicted oxidoreductase